jgi:hypothetical protein
MSFNPQYWIYLGFMSGGVFAGLLGFAGHYVMRNTRILPENVFRHACKVLASNAYIKKELGGLAADTTAMVKACVLPVVMGLLVCVFTNR